MKIVMGVHSEDEYVAELRAAFSQVTIEHAGTVEEEVEQVRDAEIHYGFLTEEVFKAALQLKWAHLPGAGINALVTIPGFVESDVVLTNARGPHAPSMADHAIGMMVILARRWMQIFEDQRERRWDPQKYVSKMDDLVGRTMGILAHGDVGTEVARRAHGFGMNVYAVDKHSKPDIPEVKATWGLDRLDELLAISDWFVVTAPITPETRGLIDARRLGLLKTGARIIIVSRGGIVDEEALMAALQDGRLAGAGIDAFQDEPLHEDHALWSMENVVITPHISGSAAGVRVGYHQIFRENLRRYLAGEPFLYVCDKKAGF